MFGGNMNNMMAKVQKMQQEMEKAQEEIKQHTEEGCSGGGLVKIILNGDDAIENIDIDKSLFEEDSQDLISDLIIAAHREAKSKMQAYSKEKMSEITKGMPIPPNMI